MHMFMDCSEQVDCGDQVQVQTSEEAGNFDAEAAVQHLAVAHQDPLMLAGCCNGCVYLYDLRQSQKAAASVQPHTSSMVGLPYGGTFFSCTACASCSSLVFEKVTLASLYIWVG